MGLYEKLIEVSERISNCVSVIIKSLNLLQFFFTLLLELMLESERHGNYWTFFFKRLKNIYYYKDKMS